MPTVHLQNVHLCFKQTNAVYKLNAVFFCSKNRTYSSRERALHKDRRCYRFNYSHAKMQPAALLV